MSNYSKQTGFTMIELVVVIAILAIISAVAISRFSGPSTYTVYAAQSQAISVIRQLQLRDMQLAPTSDVLADPDYAQSILYIQGNCLGTADACRNDNDDVSARVGGDNSPLRFTSSYRTIRFDRLGRPERLCPNGENSSADYSKECALNNQIMITINDDTDASKQAHVCINAQGFVYAPDMNKEVCDE